MEKLEDIFSDVVILRGAATFMYSKKNVIQVLNYCQEKGIKILGIDAFYLTEHTTQPSLDNSIDYSVMTLLKVQNVPDPIQFILDKDEKLFFEIVYEE